MRKECVLFLLAMLVLMPLASAEIKITKTAIVDAVAKEVSTPAIYNYTLENDAFGKRNITIYTLLDMVLSAREPITVLGGEKSNFKFEIYPGEQIRKKEGAYQLVYFIKSEDPEIKDSFFVRIVSLYNALSLEMPAKIYLKDSEAIFEITNKENLYIPEARFVIGSAILNYAKMVEIEPNSVTKIAVPLGDKLGQYEAGQYSADVSLSVNGNEGWKISDSITLESVMQISSKETKEGWFLYPSSHIVKRNDGNTLATANVRVEKDSLSKIFTKTSVAPNSLKQIKGKFVYEWQKDLKPNESFVVDVSTNYFIPLIVLVLIAAAAAFLWMSTTKPVVLTKRVTKVKTKGGEFAFKINLFLKSFVDAKNIKVIDLAPQSLPAIHNKFGAIYPAYVKGRRIEWHVDRMYKGEERVFTYIVYSKLALIGEITVPKALATYQDMLDRNKKTYSNSVFFMAEEKRFE
jgi:hypothetical protein